MFLRNWYKAVASVFGQYSSINFKNYQGTELMLYRSNNYLLKVAYDGSDTSCPAMKNVVTNYTSTGGVIFGTGTTPPTLEDYSLSGTLITTITCTSSLTTKADAEGMTLTALYTITNTASTAITIGEIALMCNLYNSSNSTHSYKGLVERTVLDEPVTIEPGGVGQVTYTIEFKYPTA